VPQHRICRGEVSAQLRDFTPLHLQLLLDVRLSRSGVLRLAGRPEHRSNRGGEGWVANPIGDEYGRIALTDSPNLLGR